MRRCPHSDRLTLRHSRRPWPMSLQTGLKTRAASVHRLIGQLGYHKGLFVWSDWTATVIPGPQQGPIPDY
ncbi:unnamed protein product [Sphagnum jensenii]|uniref:Transposase n=1 Tax=Sphagnum jensenii TaxID=128206 RepID=A0ABP0WNK8_9BRYO